MLLKLAVNSPKDNAVDDTRQTRQRVIYELGRVDGTAGGRGAATVGVSVVHLLSRLSWQPGLKRKRQGISSRQTVQEKSFIA